MLMHVAAFQLQDCFDWLEHLALNFNGKQTADQIYKSINVAKRRITMSFNTARRVNSPQQDFSHMSVKKY